MILKFKTPRTEIQSNMFFRSLTHEDFDAYKKLRLKLLASDDKKFFAECGERERTDDVWRTMCTEKFDGTGQSVGVGLGAFLLRENGGACFIGSSLIERFKDDPTGKTAFYKTIGVDETYRRAGTGEGIELAQDYWALTHGYDKAVFVIRACKERWVRRQIDVFGARIVMTNRLLYANGETADTHVLERSLIKSSALVRLIEIRDPLDKATQFMGETLNFIKNLGQPAPHDRSAQGGSPPRLKFFQKQHAL